MNPELKQHLKQIAESNERDRQWTAGETYGHIQSLCEITISHLVCAGQAAWREDKPLLRVHLNHVREATKLVLKTYNTLSPDEKTGEAFSRKWEEPPE